MKINNNTYQTVWLDEEESKICVIDQRLLPHKFAIHEIHSSYEAGIAIKDMIVRGAPLIGVTAAYGLYLATLEANVMNYKAYIKKVAEELNMTRPTAVNLSWAIQECLEAIETVNSLDEIRKEVLSTANRIKQEDATACRQIGEHGLKIIKEIYNKKKTTVNILTHCNAGWLACIEWGTATSPIYQAHNAGIPVHVWVDETRPRNQGANLTAWEMKEYNIPHTVIVDNAGGHLMQHQMVDLVITGADRVTRNGDAANKIGTYLKALAAKDNNIPFYIAIPFSSIDWTIGDGVSEIEIEQRSEEEVKYIQGFSDGEIKKILITPIESPAANYGFDVTPARLITGLITEKGICPASEIGLKDLG